MGQLILIYNNTKIFLPGPDPVQLSLPNSNMDISLTSTLNPDSNLEQNPDSNLDQLPEFRLISEGLDSEFFPDQVCVLPYLSSLLGRYYVTREIFIQREGHGYSSSKKKFFLLEQSPIPQLVDNCTYGTMAFPLYKDFPDVTNS